MLSSFFQSKNQKLVKRWESEHVKMVELAHKVLGEYAKGEHQQAKKYLKDFSRIGIDHIVSEDIEFFKLERQVDLDPQTRDLIDEFVSSFGDVKETLMKFLGKYTLEETPLDEEFFDTFSAIAEILGQRIKFEEGNLYLHLSLE